MNEYLKELVKYGKVAYQTGQRLTVDVTVRKDRIDWRMSLNKLVAHGEDKAEEEIL
jgi:hypothetical protein